MRACHFTMLYARHSCLFLLKDLDSLKLILEARIDRERPCVSLRMLCHDS